MEWVVRALGWQRPFGMTPNAPPFGMTPNARHKESPNLFDLTQPFDRDFGNVKLRFRPPDNLDLVMTGEPLKEHTSFLATIKEICEARPVYMTVEFDEGSNISPGLRKDVASGVKPEWFMGVTYIKASLALKMVLKTLYLAVLLSGKSTYEATFSKDRAEAMREIARMRSEREAASQPDRTARTG